MKVKKFQEGGMAPAPAEQGAPQEAQTAQDQANAQQQLMGLAQQIIQQMGPEAAMMLAQIILQMGPEAAMMLAQIIQQMGPAAMMLAQIIVDMVQGGAQEQQPVFARKGTKIERIQ